MTQPCGGLLLGLEGVLRPVTGVTGPHDVLGDDAQLVVGVRLQILHCDGAGPRSGNLRQRNISSLAHQTPSHLLLLQFGSKSRLSSCGHYRAPDKVCVCISIMSISSQNSVC